MALVVAGNADPRYLSSLKDVAAKLGVHDRVVWAGFVGGQRKSEVMADSDIFVLPSHSENFGIAVAEAMAAGLPVVVSDQVGIHREISRTGAGLVVPLDVDRLASALEKLAGDPRLRRAMGLRGRELAEHEYSHSAVTERILSAYNGIVA